MYVDRVVNLIDEGLDVGIRIGDLPDSSLTAVRCGTVRQIVFAAPEYIKKHGLPMHPEELKDHTLIQSVAAGGSHAWDFQVNGARCSVHIKPRAQMNTYDAAIEMALRGWGISRVISYQISPFIEAGRLKPVLEEFELPSMPIHVVHQEGRMVSGKVRAFVDFMVERLRSDKHIN